LEIQVSIQINTASTILLDGEPTRFRLYQDEKGTTVLTTGGHTVTMPHTRYSLTTSYGLNPGVAGLNQFEADIRLIVDREHAEYLASLGHVAPVAVNKPACWADPGWLESGGIVDGLITREDMSACGSGWVPLFKTTEVNQELVFTMIAAAKTLECDGDEHGVAADLRVAIAKATGSAS
jgi:hypothetical protein